MRNYLKVLPIIFVIACAGLQRDCSSSCASSLGSDWIVLQYRADGEPINCWQLKNTAIDNESHTDGIYWLIQGGHLVHISGWYNRVQVSNNDWTGAAKSIGVDLSRCTGGKYKAVEK